MSALTAREALDPRVARVTTTMRPVELAEPARRMGLYAVFDDESGRFLTLVPAQDATPFPHRIFADLLPKSPPAPVVADAPLDAVSDRMATEGVEALPVLDDRGAFLGVITRVSLLEALLRRERELLAEAHRLEERFGVEKQRLVAWSKRLEELNQASRSLLSLVAWSPVEQKVLQEGLQALVTLLQARYGAIGITDEAGGLQQFLFTGLTAGEADRIGELPQGRGLLGVVIRENQVLRLADLTQDPRYAGFPAHHPPMKRLLAAPISYQGQVYGRVYLCDKTTGEPFTEDDEQMALSFARSIALALAHGRELAERVRTEEALRESEAKWHSLVENAPDIIFTVDREGRIMFINRTPAGLTTEEAIGTNALDYVVPEYREVVRQAIRRAFETGEPGDYEIAARGSHNTTSWYATRLGPVRRNGEVIAATLVARDITERKRAQEALQESELWLRGIFESQQDAVFVVTPDRRLLNMNAAAERMIGYSLEELKSLSTEVLHVDRQHYIEFGEHIRDAFARDETARLEFHMKRKNGEIFPVEHAVSLLKNMAGEPVGVVSVARDITERKQAEEGLQLSEARFKAVVSSAKDSIFVKDRSLRYVLANPAMATLLDMPVEEILGKSDGDLFGPEIAGHMEVVDRRVLAGEMVEEEPAKLVRGKLFTFHTIKCPLRGPKGEVLGLCGIARDITERKQAEEALHEMSVALTNAMPGISRLDSEGRYAHVNEAYASMLGYATSELLGMDWKLTVHPDDQEHVIATYKDRAIRGKVEFEARAVRKDGSEFYKQVLMVKRVDEGGNFLGHHCFMRDITEHKLVEEALRKSEETHRMVVQNINEIIYAVRMEADPFGGTVQLVGDQVENIIGYRPDEFLQDPGLWSRLIHPDDVPAVAETTQELFARKEPATRVYRVRHKETAEYRWMEDKVVPQIDDRGNVIGIFGVARDITERKQAEETLQALYQAGLAIQEPMGLQERLDRLLQTARDVLHLDRLNILLADPEGRWLEGVATLGTKEPPEAMRVPIGPEGGGLAQAYLSQQPVIWADSQAPVPEGIQIQHPYTRLEAFRSRAFALLPLVVQGRAIGVMGADRKHTRRPLEPALLPLLQLFAGQAAIAIDNSRLFEQIQAGRERLQTLSRKFVETQEAERKHLARELHDEIGQALSAVKINLHTLQQLSESPPLHLRLDESIDIVEHAIQQIRDLSFAIRPSILDDLGLAAALRWHVDRHAQRAGFVGRVVTELPEMRLPPEIETACFRVAQEALTNVVGHAQARHVNLEVRLIETELELLIQDDGVGFDVPAAQERAARGVSFGLLGMQERVHLVGGHIEIRAVPKGGTSVHARFPLGAHLERQREAQDLS